MDMQLTQAQRQVLSQRMIQSVNILQMSAQELTEYIKKVAMENPLVDLEEPEQESKDQERLKKLEWLANLDEQNRVYYRREYEESDANDIMNIGSRDEETLADNLLSQLIGMGYTDEEYRVFEYIAQCLDSNGFYTGAPGELAERCQITAQKAEEMLEVMRNLEPAGVCAPDLVHCLLKQLEREGDKYQVEREIVAEYLELLGKNQLHVIAKKMHLSIERVKEAQMRIRSLNPKPSSGFSDREVLRYLTPDVTVVKLEGYFEVLVNDTACPVMQINQEYMKMLKGACPEEAKDYIMEKFRQVEQIQGCIMKRNNTLTRLTKCLVDNQKEFFMYGKGHLKPFKMKDAAEMLDVHESTISRTVKEKYLQCCWGIFPLGYFFSKGFNNGENSGNIATIQLKEQLKKIIDEEDKSKPLSDQKLMEKLAEQGVQISRRTVTKYRESMQIADCRGRKQYSS